MTLARCCKIEGIVARYGRLKIRDGKPGIESQPRRELRPRFIHSAAVRQDRGVNETTQGKISIGLDGSAKPRGRFFIAAEKTRREAGRQKPNIGPRITRAEAERFQDVRLGLLGATDEQFVLSDQRMSSGHVTIQSQRSFVFSDALGGAVGEAEDHAQG